MSQPALALDPFRDPADTVRESFHGGWGPTELYLSAKSTAQLAYLVEVSFPFEACGLMIGREEEGQIQIERITHARNLNELRARDRYLLDPEDFLAADCAARADGLEVVGIWHSHPDAPAQPSKTDFEAAWEGYSYLIISISAYGATDFRSWRLCGDRFLEEKLCRTEDLPAPGTSSTNSRG